MKELLKGSPTLRKRLELVSGAIETGSLIRFSYTNASGLASVRTIRPEEVLTPGRAVRVRGYCHLRKAERVFSLERMSRARIVEKPGKSYVRGSNGKYPPLPKFRKRTAPVVLRDFTDEDGSRYLEARLTPAGDLEVEGQDRGPGVAKVFGRGFRDYEWCYLVKRKDFPRLARALQAPPGTDILNLIQFRCTGPGAREIGEVISEEKIPHELRNWLGE